MNVIFALKPLKFAVCDSVEIYAGIKERIFEKMVVVGSAQNGMRAWKLIFFSFIKFQKFENFKYPKTLGVDRGGHLLCNFSVARIRQKQYLNLGYSI